VRVTAPDTRPGASSRLDHVDLYLAAADRFAAAVLGVDLRAPVASCPGWSTYDLVCHLGNVHSWAATIVETRVAAPEQNDEPRSRRPRAVAEWYAGKAEDLYRVLRAADPDVPCWNFAYGEGPTGFWSRRQLHETTIHLLDLLPDTDLDPLVCADGVDEVLGVFLRRMHERGHPAALTAPLCLVATDVDRAWTVMPRVEQPGGIGVPQQPRGSAAETAPLAGPPAGPAGPPAGPPLVVERRHPSADRVEAPAEVLYRLLWKRLPLDHPAVRRTGDVARVQAFLLSRLVP
jgi:uncharacterized protein (TIGR03083 family)